MSNNTNVIYAECPGAGALAYTQTLTDGLTRERAAAIVGELLASVPTDRRVKRCDYCGYYFRDDSMRNTKRTCCADCRTGAKTLQRRQQRADKQLVAAKPPRKKTKRQENYIWWYEYPFWLDEYEMLKQGWKYEVPHSTELMDVVLTQQKVYGGGNSKVKAKQPGAEDAAMGKQFNSWTRARLRGV